MTIHSEKNEKKARNDKNTYYKKQAGKAVESTPPSDEELAAALEADVAERRAVKAHVPLASINRGALDEGDRDAAQARAEEAQAARKLAKKEQKAKDKAAAKAKRVERKRARSLSDSEPDKVQATAPPPEPAAAESSGGFFGFFRSLVSAH
jgi:hypothetical protein|mmetsp:Transcript_29783/g.101253  ORF Transcript_29783/g.101253 Transcript_29783/m.101253 type:complete len:151 (+) Transcript_29783:168-620(+)